MSAGATASQALALVFGLCFAGAFVVILASRFIRLASSVITPVVTGTVVTLIGLTLIEVGMVSVAGGYGAKSDGTFGSLQNLGLAALVLVTILVFNSSRRPNLRMLSVVIGLGRRLSSPRSARAGWISAPCARCRSSPCHSRSGSASPSTGATSCPSC